MKTGYTNASGYNLVMSAVRDNRRLIGVVMGGNTAFQRDKLMAELMDQGFATAEAQNISPWTSPHVPSTARYSAANFVAGLDPVGLSGVGTSLPFKRRVGKHALAPCPPSIAGPCTEWRTRIGLPAPQSLKAAPMSETDVPTPRRIALLGVPIEIGASQAGTLMGPAALRTAGIARLLEQMGIPVEDHAHNRPGR